MDKPRVDNIWIALGFGAVAGFAWYKLQSRYASYKHYQRVSKVEPDRQGHYDIDGVSYDREKEEVIVGGDRQAS